MPKISQFKVVASLPATLEPDAVYYVRVGTGFDIYVTNSSGTVVAYPSNQVNPPTVTTEEAQTGAEAGLRSWSPLRVRQAITAWWSASSSSWGRSLVTQQDAPSARSYIGLGTASTASLSAFPVVNLLPDSGRFSGKINPMQVVATTFSAPAFFAAFNGASHSSGGQFFYDNSTNGGAGGALAEPVSSLLSAMGRTGIYARYGVEFFVDTLTFGSGTVSQLIGADSVTRYLATTNGTRPLFQADNFATIAMWLRARTSAFHISTGYYKNGVKVASGTPITVSDGWVHVRVVTQNIMGFDNAWPYICGVSGGSVNIALPALFNGVADIGLHANPIATINELSA